MRGNGAILLLAALASVPTVSCTKTELYSYENWAVSDTWIAATPGPRGARMGHLLESSDGIVLSVERCHPGNLVIIDDEWCETVFIEVPREVLKSFPAVLEDPRAYLKTCSSVWGNCTEEPAVAGTVVLNSRDAEGIRGSV